MTTKKLCITCALAETADKPIGQRINRVTLGRECAKCHATTERGEIMVPIDDDEGMPVYYMNEMMPDG